MLLTSEGKLVKWGGEGREEVKKKREKWSYCVNEKHAIVCVHVRQREMRR